MQAAPTEMCENTRTEELDIRKNEEEAVGCRTRGKLHKETKTGAGATGEKEAARKGMPHTWRSAKREGNRSRSQRGEGGSKESSAAYVEKRMNRMYAFS